MRGLYHGSVAPNIEEFQHAERSTIAKGIYFTSQSEQAAEYAQRRVFNSHDSQPTLYEADIENLTLANLTNQENAYEVLQGFGEQLRARFKNSELTWYEQNGILRALDGIEAIRLGKGNLQDAVFAVQTSFSAYLQNLGFDGLVAQEGGEPPDVQPHDSYVIFDPADLKIVGEHSLGEK